MRKKKELLEEINKLKEENAQLKKDLLNEIFKAITINELDRVMEEMEKRSVPVKRLMKKVVCK